LFLLLYTSRWTFLQVHIYSWALFALCQPAIVFSFLKRIESKKAPRLKQVAVALELFGVSAINRRSTRLVQVKIVEFHNHVHSSRCVIKRLINGFPNLPFKMFAAFYRWWCGVCFSSALWRPWCESQLCCVRSDTCYFQFSVLFCASDCGM
jgi:hypothetical protein